jgi:hypothetical protein
MLIVCRENMFPPDLGGMTPVKGRYTRTTVY